MARLRSTPEILARQGELLVERDPARPSGRLLVRGSMEISYIDLADPLHLEFDYMRWMRLILRLAGARRVVHVGGAACALARALAVEDPDSRQEVCESDPEVLEFSRRHLGLRRMAGLRVRVGDGRQLLAAQADGSWHAVAIDAFIGARVPRHLVTVQALRHAARVAPLALVNVVDNRGQQEVNAIGAALSEAFPAVWALSGRSGNSVLAGTRQSLDLDLLAARVAADPSPTQLIGPGALARRLAGVVPPQDDVPLA